MFSQITSCKWTDGSGCDPKTGRVLEGVKGCRMSPFAVIFIIGSGEDLVSESTS